MAEAHAWLVFEDREVPITQDVVTLGRSRDNDIPVSGRFVSGTHAEIRRTADGYVLRDLDSRNGTYVNGREMSRHRLQHGDRVDLAHACEFEFCSDEGTAILPARRGLHVDVDRHEITVDGQEIEVSLLQYRLLKYLYENENRSLHRDEVIEEVWEGAGVGVSDAAIDSLVNRVRSTIAEVDPEFEYIHTIRGLGFRFHNKR